MLVPSNLTLDSDLKPASMAIVGRALTRINTERTLLNVQDLVTVIPPEMPSHPSQSQLSPGGNSGAIFLAGCRWFALQPDGFSARPRDAHAMTNVRRAMSLIPTRSLLDSLRRAQGGSPAPHFLLLAAGLFFLSALLRSCYPCSCLRLNSRQLHSSQDARTGDGSGSFSRATCACCCSTSVSSSVHLSLRA